MYSISARVLGVVWPPMDYQLDLLIGLNQSLIDLFMGKWQSLIKLTNKMLLSHYIY